MNKNHKEEKRIDNSLIFIIEKKYKIPNFILEHMPSFITPRMLMTTGFISAILAGICFFLTTFDKLFFIGSASFVLIYLFCDRYDGRLARFKKITSKRGYYADHMFDTLSLLIIFLGLGLSPAMHFILAMSIVIVYYIIAINVFLMTYVKGVFKCDFFGVGPAEGLFGLAFLSIISLFFPYPLTLFHTKLLGFGSITFIDFIMIIALFGLIYIAISSIIKNFIYMEQFEKKYRTITFLDFLKTKKEKLLENLEELKNLNKSVLNKDNLKLKNFIKEFKNQNRKIKKK